MNLILQIVNQRALGVQEIKMSTQIEFMPWNIWIKMPEHKDLSVNEAKKMYDIERDRHMKRQMYFEAQRMIKNHDRG